MLKDKAYHTLKSMVDNGQLRIIFIFGPPRSGTTAFERQIHEISGGMNINHPDIEPDVLNKKISVWENILQKISLLDKPATIVVKITSDFIAAKEEISLWRDLSEVMFCCFRNPILQMESFLALNLRYLLENRYQRAEVNGRLYDDKFLINGESFHSDAANLITKKESLKGDYSGLQKGFLWTLIQWEYDRPSLLQSVWQSYFTNLIQSGKAQTLAKGIRESGAHSAQELIDRHKNAGPTDFKSFPKILRDALAEWSFGWTATQQQITELGNDPKLIMVDFTSAQLDPEGFCRKIEGALRNFATKPIAFDIGHESEIAFEGARNHHKLLPPDKKPIPLNHYPNWMHELIEQALGVYTEMLQDKRLVTSFETNAYMRATQPLPNDRSLIGIHQIDPIYAYSQLVDFATKHPKFARPRIQIIEDNSPEMKPYFQMCDRMAQQRNKHLSAAG